MSEMYELPKRSNYFVSLIYRLMIVASFFLGLEIGTQYIAITRHIPSEGTFLGLHSPWSCLVWAYRYEFMNSGFKDPSDGAIISTGLQVAVVSVVVLYFVSYLLNLHLENRFKKSDVHGSSQWADINDIKKAGLV